MAAQKKTEQTMRYSDEEIGIIKATFADNDYLIKVLRKFLLQGALNETEKSLLESFASQPNSMKVFEKTIKPEIDLDAPAFQMTDLYVNIDTKEASVEKAYPLMLARDLLSDYLEQQLNKLKGISVDSGINFMSLKRTEGKTPLVAFTELSARNTLISHVEFQLLNLKTLAGGKEETVEETKARLIKNSNK